MKRHPRKNKEQVALLHLWSHQETLQAVPYLRSILTSLREHWHDWQQQSLQAQRLAQKPRRPNRAERIAHQEATQAAARAEGQFHEALEELQELDVQLQDPNQGLALVPFGHEGELAWFIFDLFAPQGLSGWRFHRDNLDTCHPLTEAMIRGRPVVQPRGKMSMP